MRGFAAAAIFLSGIVVMGNFNSELQAAPLTQSFACLGNPEYFTVPTDVYSISFDMHGASDGWHSSCGARVTGTVAAIPGEELEIKVGCTGSVNGGTGGFPNGGQGGGQQGQNSASGGGGSSSIVADHAARYEVLAVAGGAGGSTNYAIGGNSGMNGNDAASGWVDMQFMDGKGATQTTAGGQTCNLVNFCYGAGSYLQGGESPYGGGGAVATSAPQGRMALPPPRTTPAGVRLRAPSLSRGQSHQQQQPPPPSQQQPSRQLLRLPQAQQCL